MFPRFYYYSSALKGIKKRKKALKKAKKVRPSCRSKVSSVIMAEITITKKIKNKSFLKRREAKKDKKTK